MAVLIPWKNAFFRVWKEGPLWLLLLICLFWPRRKFEITQKTLSRAKGALIDNIASSGVDKCN